MTSPISSLKKLSPFRAALGYRLVALAFLLLSGRPGRTANFAEDVLLLRNDAQGITVRYRLPAVQWRQLEMPDRTYRTPIVPGTGMSWPEGAPQLPVRVVWLVIPPGANAALGGITPFGGASSSDVPAPVPTEAPQAGGSVGIVYQEDPGFYASLNPFPTTWVELQGPEPYRDLRVVRLLIYPFRFPSAAGGLLSLDSIEVHVQLQGGSPGTGAFSPPLENQFYHNVIANWAGTARNWKVPKAAQTDMQDPWPAGDLYRIKIEGSGIYRITYNDLVGAGVNLTGLDPRTIRIFNNGGEVLPKNLQTPRPPGPIENAIKILGEEEEDGVFDSNDEIWFYGRSVHEWKWNSVKGRYTHYRNPYTDQNIYWLNINPTGPEHKQMAPLGLSGDSTLTPWLTRAYYVEEKELNVVYDDYNLPQSMPDFYGDVFSGPSSRTFNIIREGVSTSAPAHLTLKLRSADASAHTFQVFLNDNLLLTTYSTSIEKDLSPGLLQSGTNYLRLEHQSTGTAYIDYFEIEYSRDLSTTSSGQLAFVSPAANGVAKYNLGQQISPPWTPNWIFNVTDYANVKLTPSASFKDSSSASAPRRYLAITTAAFKTPLSIAKDMRGTDGYVNLRSTLGADLLVLCGDAFYDAMAAYEDYRENDAPTLMDVLRVKMSDIYDEYGWGLVDPAAIRDFLNSTLPLYNWVVSPIYVLFAGDGDFDYKNRLSSGDDNWVIPFVQNSRCTDDWYSYFTPTDNVYAFPQLATGRWPARSIEDIEELIARLIAYETAGEFGPWQDIVTFVADDEYGPGGAFQGWEATHTEDSEYILETFVPPILNKNKIYLTEYPVSWDPAGGGRRKPEAAADLMKAINEGRLLVNFMGHGNPTVWAHEHVLLQSRDLPLMNNGSKLPLFVAATCDWAFWDSPYDQSMPEMMLTLPGGGAIAAMAATRVTGAGANSALAQNFYEALFEEPGGIPLGLALMRAKSRFFVKNENLGYNNTNSEKYHILGDPVMKLAMPQLPIQLNSSTSDTLFALQQVIVSGSILSQTGSPLNAFLGEAHLEVFDTRIPIYYGFNNGPPPVAPTYFMPGNLIFRGDCTVEDGQFQATFVVPIDINYGGLGGRFSVLAYSNDMSAVGANDSVVIGQSAATLQDYLPPQVSLYFDSPAFRSGGLVSPEAKLYVEVFDSNGVNLTGSVGHGITVTIDGQNPIDLTDAFSYDLDSYRRGRAEYQFPPGELSSGQHSAEAMAWDAANNPNTAQVSFEVLSSGQLGLSNVLNYPNPFDPAKETTRFTFDLAEAATVTIKIFTVAGRLVKAIRDVPVDDQFDSDNPLLVWDGRDEQGDLLSNGVYLYKVSAQSEDGKSAEEIGKLVVMR